MKDENLPKQIKFVIENNKGKEIITDIVMVENTKLTIILDIENELPGRYYLKLFTDDTFTLISFFLHKSKLQ